MSEQNTTTAPKSAKCTCARCGWKGQRSMAALDKSCNKCGGPVYRNSDPNAPWNRPEAPAPEAPAADLDAGWDEVKSVCEDIPSETPQLVLEVAEAPAPGTDEPLGWGPGYGPAPEPAAEVGPTVAELEAIEAEPAVTLAEAEAAGEVGPVEVMVLEPTDEQRAIDAARDAERQAAEAAFDAANPPAGPDDELMPEAREADDDPAAWASARYTEAPENYDGFGTRTLDPCVAVTDGGRPVRRVAIRAEHLEWQEARYNSGMFACLSEERYRGMLTCGYWKVPAAAPPAAAPTSLLECRHCGDHFVRGPVPPPVCPNCVKAGPFDVVGDTGLPPEKAEWVKRAVSDARRTTPSHLAPRPLFLTDAGPAELVPGATVVREAEYEVRLPGGGAVTLNRVSVADQDAAWMVNRLLAAGRHVYARPEFTATCDLGLLTVLASRGTPAVVEVAAEPPAAAAPEALAAAEAEARTKPAPKEKPAAPKKGPAAPKPSASPDGYVAPALAKKGGGVTTSARCLCLDRAGCGWSASRALNIVHKPCPRCKGPVKTAHELAGGN